MLARAHRFSPLMFVLLLTAMATVAPLSAQERPASAPPAPTADDYARAEKFLAPALTSLVVGGSVSPAWLPDDRFTYRSTTADGVQFLLVDPVKATRVPAFDHVKLAAALGAAAGGTFDPKKLPFQAIELSADGKSVAFDIEARRWSCDVAGTACKARRRGQGRPRRGGGRQGSRPGRRRGERGRLARRQARGVHQGLEPLGPRRRDGPGEGAHHRRREGLRLRHRQRRLAAQRPRHRALVARLEEGRHLPAGRAQGRRHVPGRDEGRAPGASASGSTRSRATSTSPCSTASSSTSTPGPPSASRWRPTTTAPRSATTSA